MTEGPFGMALSEEPEYLMMSHFFVASPFHPKMAPAPTIHQKTASPPKVFGTTPLHKLLSKPKPESCQTSLNLKRRDTEREEI